MTNASPIEYKAVWSYTFTTTTGGDAGAIDAAKQADTVLRTSARAVDGSAILVVENAGLDQSWFFDMESGEPQFLFSMGIPIVDYSAPDPGQPHQFNVTLERTYTLVAHEDIGRTPLVCAQIAAAALWTDLKYGKFESPADVVELGDKPKHYQVSTPAYWLYE